jgi:hypothetical protein
MRNRAHLKLSIRVPAKWVSHIDSAQLKSWLSDFVADPFLLPRDRGPVEGLIIRLSVPRGLLRSFRRKVRGAPSSALRRLISTRLTDVPEAPEPSSHFTKVAVPAVQRPPELLSEPLSLLGWHEGRAISPLRWRESISGVTGGVTGKASGVRDDCHDKRKKC